MSRPAPDVSVPEHGPTSKPTRQWESEALLVAGKLHLFYYFRDWAIALAPIDVGDVPTPFAADVRRGPDPAK